MYITKMKKIICFTLLLLSCTEIRAKRARGMKVTHEIAWDPRFTEELRFGMIHEIEVHIDEYMDLFCPQYDADAPSPLKFIIYNVSKQSFDQCVVTEEARKIFSCDRPSFSNKLTTKFQKRSPNPLGFVFQPGRTYYYMALVEDRESKSGNPCDKAMRMSIKVRPKFVHGHTTSTKPQTTTAKISATTTTSKPVKTTTTFTQTIKRTSVLPSLTATSEKHVVVNPQQQTGGRGSSNRLHCSIALLWLSLIITWLFQR